MGGTPRPRSRAVPWGQILLLLAFCYVLTDHLLAAADIEDMSDDFWPQWTLVHLAASGRGAEAYDFGVQCDFLRRLNFPDQRMDLLKRPQIKDIGVCPYPPTFALIYSPICRLSFNPAALVFYFASIALALVAAWAISQATIGRLSGLLAALALPIYTGVQSLLFLGQDSLLNMFVLTIALALGAAWAFGQMTGGFVGFLTAALAILCYPATGAALQLGQNSLLTLALLSLGWRELVRRRDLMAGIWWGLLVYKIHWLAAVGWVPLVIGRWRVLLGMAGSAGLLALAATIWLGPAAWGRWFSQIAAIDHVYATNPEFRETILNLGCDFRNILLRYTSTPFMGRILGWSCIAAVAAVTAIWYRRRPLADPAGTEGAALLFASGLTAAHLYFYDETIFMLPLLVLWANRASMSRWQFVALIVLTVAHYVASRYMLVWAGAFEGPPVWTYIVIALWVLSLTVKSKESAP